MRFWSRGLVAAGGYLLTFWAERAIPHPSSSQAIVFALVAVLGLSIAAYALRMPWLSAGFGLGLTILGSLATGLMHPLLMAAAAALSGLVGFWGTRRFRWPLAPLDALLGIALLVMISLALSALLTLHSQPVSAKTAADLVVLYLSTPPWEWGIVITALLQAEYLGRFIRSRYHWRWRDLGLGFLTGVGLLFLTAIIVSVESRGFHVRVVANNPFVTTPALVRHGAGPALLISLGVIVLAPLAEEALFRGVLFSSLNDAWGYLPATLVAGTVFGLAHLNATLFLPLTLAGITLNALYRATGSLVASTAAHMTLNAISVVSALGVLR